MAKVVHDKFTIIEDIIVYDYVSLLDHYSFIYTYSTSSGWTEQEGKHT